MEEPAIGSAVGTRGKKWTLLEFDDQDKLARSIVDRERRLMFFPGIGQFKVGRHFDLEIAVLDSNVLMPLRALATGLRTRPRGPGIPRGVYLEIVEQDLERFERLCDFAEKRWEPASRRMHPRLRTELMVRYSLPPRFHSGSTFDVSSEGLFLHTDGPLLDEGKGIYLRLYPLGRWLGSIGLSAKVRWIDWVQSRRGMGLHCLEPESGLRRLARFVERLRQKQRIAQDRT